MNCRPATRSRRPRLLRHRFAGRAGGALGSTADAFLRTRGIGRARETCVTLRPFAWVAAATIYGVARAPLRNPISGTIPGP